MGHEFSPITSYKHCFSNTPGISRKRHPFNDKRLHKTFNSLSAQMLGKQAIAVNQLADSHAQCMQFYRFYSNAKVSVEEVIKMSCSIQADLSNTEVLCIGDSSSINLSRRSGRIQDYDNLGVLNDDKTKGFHFHASIALDAQTGSLISLTDVIHWHRDRKTAETAKLKKALSKCKRESHKWYLGAYNSKQVLQEANAQKITFVYDREADDFELMEQLILDLKQDFVIRSKHNRLVSPYTEISDTNSTAIKLQDHLATCQVIGTYQVKIPAQNHYSSTNGKRVKREAREATLALKYTKLNVLRPKNRKGDNPITLNAIHINEVTEDLAKTEKPLQWTLWTTRSIHSMEDAMQCVQFYLWRWTIEELFRTIKKKGFNQEATELGTIDGILKQTTMCLKAATKVMQLVSARGSTNAPPINYAFDKKEQSLLHKINDLVEGNTKKNKTHSLPLS